MKERRRHRFLQRSTYTCNHTYYETTLVLSNALYITYLSFDNFYDFAGMFHFSLRGVSGRKLILSLYDLIQCKTL